MVDPSRRSVSFPHLQRHRSLGDHAEVRRLEALSAQVVSFRKCGCERKAPSPLVGQGAVQRRNQIATVTSLRQLRRVVPPVLPSFLKQLKRRELGIGRVWFFVGTVTLPISSYWLSYSCFLPARRTPHR